MNSSRIILVFSDQSFPNSIRDRVLKVIMVILPFDQTFEHLANVGLERFFGWFFMPNIEVSIGFRCDKVKVSFHFQ